jgi:aspartyl-tRNA(Asn)/glutamyl-tRNA(Gln) amidotransferase subunit C
MASKIDISEVRTVAKLARLQLSDGEVTQFSHQLSAILDYIEKLNQLDTKNVEPLAHCLPVSNIFRADIVVPSLGVEKALANAPDRDNEFFKVPRILDDNAGA